MSKFRFILAGTLLLGALGYIGLSAMRSGWVYYVDVDQLVSEPGLGRGRVRVHGEVTSLTTDGVHHLFELRGVTHALVVEHNGPLPDTFAEGREAVIEGRLDEHGRLRAELVLTKCASKYTSEPASGRPRGIEPEVGP